jgi:tetratricopeptide (TPR) repeat protein
MFERTLETVSERRRALEGELQEVDELFERLLGQGSSRALETIRADESCRSWGLVIRLMEKCRDLSAFDARRAVEVAALAVEASRLLDTALYGKARVLDLQARAYCALANVQRILSSFREAERSFQTAKELLAEGSGDALQRANILLLEAEVYGQRDRFDRAFGLLDQVIRIARRFEDAHLQGKALINKGLFLSYAERVDEALRLFHAGIELIDPAIEPRPLLVAWHNIFFSLSYLGRNEEALEKLPYIRSLHEKFGTRLDRLRLYWVEGRIAVDLGEVERAEQCLVRVRDAFIEAGIGYDAALVSLDLANVYLRQGRSEAVAQLAQEILPIFKSRDVHREAIAALIVFQRAVERNTVNVQLIAEIERYLRQARNNPSLRFEPSSS